MSVDTKGEIKGLVKWEDILNYIKQKYDFEAKANISREYLAKLSNLKQCYVLNEHSESEEWNYLDCGFISFNYCGESRMLFYYYNNVRSLKSTNPNETEIECLEIETTSVSLGYWGGSVKIITDIVANFGGGWIDSNDCDNIPYLPIICNPDKTIKPVRVVTMQEIYDKFGGVVIIQKT